MTARTTMTALMSAVCFAGVHVAEAQMQPPAPPQPAPQAEAEAQQARVMQELTALHEQSGRIQEKLTAIAQEAVEANPEIMELHSSLMATYQSKLAEHGYPDEEEMQRLVAMQQQLQSPGAGDMDDEARTRLTQEFNAGVAKLQEAQEAAQNDPEVRKAQAEFEETRLEAMQEVNPRTEELQRQEEKLQAEMQELRLSLQPGMPQAPRQ